MRLSGLLRNIAGSGLASKPVTVKKVSDGSTVASTTTDGSGAWSVDLTMNPAGRLYWESTDGSTTRRSSSAAIGTFGGGSLYDLAYLIQGLGDGVLSGVLNAFATSATGTRSVSVESGVAAVKGILCSNPAAVTVAGTANATGSTRIDTLVIEVTRLGQTEEGKSEFKIVAGTTVAPTLTQSASLWQFPLANLSLPNGGTSYTVTDTRSYFALGAGSRNPVVTDIARVTSGSGNISNTTLTDFPSLGTTVTLVNGVVYDLDLWGSVLVSPGGAAATVTCSTYVAGTDASQMSVTGNVTQPLVYAQTLQGVQGTGAAVSCGVKLAKSSGSSPTAGIGCTIVRAIPRW